MKIKSIKKNHTINFLAFPYKLLSFHLAYTWVWPIKNAYIETNKIINNYFGSKKN